MNTLERFIAKVEPTEDCWNWTGAVQTGGYGFFQGKLAHRLAYEWMVGPIPPGLTIDHLCYNRLCINPAHLEPVTSAENIRRAAARRTHCKRGHELTDANTPPGRSKRCLTCQREVHNAWERARYHAAKAAS